MIASAVEATVQLRRARPAQARALTRLAWRSKRYWGYPRRWMRWWRGELTVTRSYLRATAVFCAIRAAQQGRREESIEGFCAVADRGGGTWEIEHLWIRPERMRAGIGRLLLREARAEAERGGAGRLRVVSDPHAEGFYLRQGARRCGVAASRPVGRVLPVLEFPCCPGT